MKPKIKPVWLDAPINCTCEVMVNHRPMKLCDLPTTAAYPAMGGGWMSLCARHAKKHLPHGAYLTDDLIVKGAKWK